MMRMAQETVQNKRSGCPLVIALDVVGDKWSLVILRDLVKGKMRFGELCASEESIPTNILTSRLKMFEEHGIVDKRLYQTSPRRYEYQLTPKGADLIPVMQSLARWGEKYGEDIVHPPAAFFELSPEAFNQLMVKK